MPPNISRCTAMNVNGGIWVFNPTEMGRMMLEMWLAYIWEDSVVKGKIWNGTSTLDYVFLVGVILQGATTMPLYKVR